MGKERAKRLVLFTAVIILPAVFVRLELCPLASVCSPVHSEQAAAVPPCHQQQDAPAPTNDAQHPSCCQDINPIETQTAKVSAPLVVDVIAFLDPPSHALADTRVAPVLFDAPAFYPADPPIFLSYQTLLV